MVMQYGAQLLAKVGRRINANGAYVEPMVGSDAVTITRDQILEWTLEGRVFHAQQGDAGTLVDFAEVAYDEDQPQWALRVPTARLVIPLRLSLTFQDQAGTDTPQVLQQGRQSFSRSQRIGVRIVVRHDQHRPFTGCHMQTRQPLLVDRILYNQ